MKHVFTLAKHIGYGLLIGMMLTGCTKDDTQKQLQAEQNKHLQELEQLKQKRTATETKLKQMSIGELVNQMEQDAEQGREPFNSPAFREIIRNKRGQGPSLLEDIKKREAISYISLLALRDIDLDSYQKLDNSLKSRVLLNEFSQSRSYNKWGLPHLYWEAAAKALIELGESSEAGLKKYLSDCQPAPVWGSEEVMEYEAYQYRRCDYALAMIMAIRGEDVKTLPKSPEERDKLIEQYLKE